VPALSSSRISPVLEQLRDLPASRVLLPGECAGLAACLALVPDPRDPRGVRHTLTSLLLATVAAVLAGARSLAAIGEWIADAPPQVPAVLGVRQDPLTGRFEPPDEATIRRALKAVDAAALDAAVGSWLAGRLQAAGQPPGHHRQQRRAVAVDGKAVRGTRHSRSDGQAVHLLAAADQHASAVLAQARVDSKTSEITQFAPLLEPLDLAGTVVTADGLHTQREHAEFLVTRKRAHNILVVKKNQPGLHAQLKNLPWRSVPVSDRQADRGHGRQEHRTLQAATITVGLAFPHAEQAICLTRQARPLDGGRWRTVTVYAITSLDAHQATPAQLAAWIRGHWQIEALHLGGVFCVADVADVQGAGRSRRGEGAGRPGSGPGPGLVT
jgi:predicted transposase YbfD/YdcC